MFFTFLTELKSTRAFSDNKILRDFANRTLMSLNMKVVKAQDVCCVHPIFTEFVYMVTLQLPVTQQHSDRIPRTRA